MQLAILLILILIAILIAPWLLGVIAVAASLYGVYLVATALIAVIVFTATVLWVLFSRSYRVQQKTEPEIIAGERKPCPFCQAEMAVTASECTNCGKAEKL